MFDIFNYRLLVKHFLLVVSLLPQWILLLNLFCCLLSLSLCSLKVKYPRAFVPWTFLFLYTLSHCFHGLKFHQVANDFQIHRSSLNLYRLEVSGWGCNWNLKLNISQRECLLSFPRLVCVPVISIFLCSKSEHLIISSLFFFSHQPHPNPSSSSSDESVNLFPCSDPDVSIILISTKL